MDYIWWEKTVEYLFVKQSLARDCIIAPLDGTHEKAGDTVIAQSGRFVLIEFKKDKTKISSEFDKFANGYEGYKQASNVLADRAKHHFFVFGLIGASGKSRAPQLCLSACGYFSQETKKIKDMFNDGVDIESFKSYLKDLFRFKKTGATGTTGFSLEDSYSLVVGVADLNNSVACMSLGDFVASFLPEFTPLIQQDFQELDLGG